MRSFFRHILATIPMHEFILDMFTFLRKPEIYDGTHEYVPLNKAGGNYIKSLLFVSVLIGVISWMSKGHLPVDNISHVLLPLTFLFILSYQAIIFGIILWFLLTISIAVKKKSWHAICFFQVLHAYAVMNLCIPALMFLGINLIVIKTVFRVEPFWISSALLIASLSIFIIFYRLLVKPIQQYVTRFYNNSTAWVITITIFILTIWLLGHFPSPFVNHVVDIEGINNLMKTIKQTCQ